MAQVLRKHERRDNNAKRRALLEDASEFPLCRADPGARIPTALGYRAPATRSLKREAKIIFRYFHSRVENGMLVTHINTLPP